MKKVLLSLILATPYFTNTAERGSALPSTTSPVRNIENEFATFRANIESTPISFLDLPLSYKATTAALVAGAAGLCLSDKNDFLPLLKLFIAGTTLSYAKDYYDSCYPQTIVRSIDAKLLKTLFMSLKNNQGKEVALAELDELSPYRKVEFNRPLTISHLHQVLPKLRTMKAVFENSRKDYAVTSQVSDLTDHVDMLLGKQ